MSLLSIDILLQAYKVGMFPMAQSRHDERILWVDPKMHGVLLMEEFHIPGRLKRTLRSKKFAISYDRNFEEVIKGCAGGDERRPDTWINDEIMQMHVALFRQGYAHSVEAWADGELVGGLYGIRIGAAFFGESMFSNERDASKVALCHLVANLKNGNFLLLDTQFVTDHLRRFGVREVPRRVYLSLLQAAIAAPAWFSRELPFSAVESLIQSSALPKPSPRPSPRPSPKPSPKPSLRAPAEIPSGQPNTRRE